MKRIFSLITGLLLASPLFAEVEVGKVFPSYSLEDQFGNAHSLAAETRVVFISSEKDVSKKISDWLKPKPKGFLDANKAEYVSDITPMPGIITTLFALPKMKKYPFTVYLADDKEFAKTYPSEDGKIAVFLLGEGQIVKEIKYIDKPEELDAHLTVIPKDSE